MYKKGQASLKNHGISPEKKINNSPSNMPDGVSEALNHFQAIQSRFLRFILKFTPWVLLLIAILNVILYKDSEPLPNILMWSSGMAMAAIATFCFRSLMHRIRETFRTLWDRGVIQTKSEKTRTMIIIQGYTPQEGNRALPEKEYCEFINSTHALLNHPWRQMLLGVIFAAITVAWLIWHYLREPVSFVQFIIEPVVGMLLGILVWRMLVVGYQIWQLGNKFDLTQLLLGHPDRCGGLEPIGNLCFWNALIISIAGVYLGALIIAASYPGMFQELAKYYTPISQPLLIILIGIAMISFFLPLLSTHRMMVAKRALIRRELDQLSQTISNISTELVSQASTMDPDEREKINKKLAIMQQLYKENRYIPTWPFNIKIISKLSSLQIAPLLAITGLGEPVVKALSAVWDFLA